MDELKHLKPSAPGMAGEADGSILDVFPNPRQGRCYTIRFETEEVTSVCPVTGQPDFYRVVIEYQPARHCIESKSLKLYLGSFRNSGMFAEDLANRLLDDLAAVCDPRWMRVSCGMKPRGGISLEVTAAMGRRCEEV